MAGCNVKKHAFSPAEIICGKMCYTLLDYCVGGNKLHRNVGNKSPIKAAPSPGDCNLYRTKNIT